jgi:hypothetical protein
VKHDIDQVLLSRVLLRSPVEHGDVFLGRGEGEAVVVNLGEHTVAPAQARDRRNRVDIHRVFDRIGVWLCCASS